MTSKRTQDGRRKSGTMHGNGAITIDGDFEDMGIYGEPRQRSFSSAGCHENHPALSIGGGTLLGGNCRDHQQHENVHVYVALDGYMKHPYFEAGTDWHTTPVSIFYPIENMCIPANPDKFKELIGYITGALKEGATVHVGCIGGHGRTGMVLAAVVAALGVSDDAIGWVRQHYCKRAVENKAQEGFLATHFGCKMPPDKYASKEVDKRGAGF